MSGGQGGADKRTSLPFSRDDSHTSTKRLDHLFKRVNRPTLGPALGAQAAFSAHPSVSSIRSLDHPHDVNMLSPYRLALLCVGVLAMSPNRASGAPSPASAAKEAPDVAADTEDWLEAMVRGSKNMVGVTGFIVAGTSVQHIQAGDATLPKAYDRVSKKVANLPRKAATINTPFMLASTSKTVTWTALTMLLDRGAFRLDDPIDGALDFSVRNPAHPGRAITYRHLYAHTSGLKDDFKGYLYGKQCPANQPYPRSLSSTLAAYVAAKSNWYKHAPGSKHHYSNMATALAALLVERLSGVGFGEYTRRFIFSPLGMLSTGWHRPSNAANTYVVRRRGGTQYDTRVGGYCYPDWPSGQLYSTAVDMAKFASAMLAGGRYRPLAGGTVACLYSEAAGKLAFSRTSPNTGDGDSALGWFVGKPYYAGGAGHDGSEEGVSADLFIKTSSGVAVGWMANGELSTREYKTLLAKLVTAAETIGRAEQLPSAPAGCKATVPLAPGGGSTTSSKTTLAPSSSPVTACADSTTWHHPRNKKRTCAWVGSRRWKRRCQLKGAKQACPKTCRLC